MEEVYRVQSLLSAWEPSTHVLAALSNEHESARITYTPTRERHHKGNVRPLLAFLSPLFSTKSSPVSHLVPYIHAFDSRRSKEKYHLGFL